MNKTIATQALPADQLVIGSQFIPKGKKHPVTVGFLSEFHGPTIDVYAYSDRGNSAHIINRYDTVDFVIPERHPLDDMFAESLTALDNLH